MEYAVVVIAALLASVIGLYSGFGLGTLLLPVFAVFFPVHVAVAATAVVHLAHNLFRIGFTARHANWGIVLRFGVPAAAGAIGGALLLNRISAAPELVGYRIGNWDGSVTVVKLVIAFLIVAFSAFDLLPKLKTIQIALKYVPFGGALSGFFGGLSGHQGALRSAILSKTGMSTAVFVGTASIAAFMVDVVRLSVYGVSFLSDDFSSVFGTDAQGLVGAAIAAAFIGNFAGSRYLKHVTIDQVRTAIGVLLVMVAVALASGII